MADYLDENGNPVKKQTSYLDENGNPVGIDPGKAAFLAQTKANIDSPQGGKGYGQKPTMGAAETLIGILSKIGGTAKGIVSAPSQFFNDPFGTTVQTIGQAASAYAQTPKDKYRTPVEPVAMAAGAAMGADTPKMADAFRRRDAGAAVVESTPLLAQAAAGPVTRGVIKGVDALPSEARASANFDKVATVANKLPVDVSEAMKAALEADRLHSNGAREVPPAIRAIMEKGQNGSIPYEDARQIYSNAIDPDVTSRQGMNRAMKRQVTASTKALDKSIRSTTNDAGVGTEYADAMSEFRRAKTMKSVGNVLLNSAKAAAFGGAGYYLLRDLLNASSGRQSK